MKFSRFPIFIFNTNKLSHILHTLKNIPKIAIDSDLDLCFTVINNNKH